MNRGPADYESAALPTELPRRCIECNIAAKNLSNIGPNEFRTDRARHDWQEIAARIASSLQRDIGYISQATPTLITTNNVSDHSVYLIQPDVVR